MPRKLLTPEERVARKKASWDRILNGQRREGSAPGTPEDWIRAFNARFGGISMPRVVNSGGAWGYFGLQKGATAAEVKRAFARKILVVHPDHGGTAEAARECIAHYESLRAVVG